MSLSPQWLDQLRSRITLSSLIGKSVRVQKAGREFKACCPFHNEKTPSFTINDEKGFYHCFGCGAHGDAIRWMTDQRGLSFMDAVKELASEAGMDVPAPDQRAAKQAEARAGLHDVMAEAARWFMAQLSGSMGAEARDYLARRGFSAETLAKFGFGFAPDSRDGLRKALAHFGDTMLIEAGLLIQVDDKAPYDRFRGRIMIPITDARGRVIAFGGRVLGQGEPKYLNSPDTPLFDKGRNLFNRDKAAPAARQSGRLIVVEGYMDAIALDAAGLGECVAPLGTAVTEQQIELMWKMVETPVLCFDGDSAGQRAAMRAALRALPLLRPGHSLDIAILPAGQDPDDLVRGAGVAAFERVLTERRPLIEHLWQSEWAALPLNTPEQRAGLRQRLMAHTEQIADRDIQQYYRQDFSERLFQAFRTQRSGNSGRKDNRGGSKFGGKGFAGNAVNPSSEVSDAARRISIDGQAQELMRAIVQGLLRYPDMLALHCEQLAELEPRDPALAAILALLIRLTLARPGLESTDIGPICEAEGLSEALDQISREMGMRFSFNSASSRPRRKEGADVSESDMALAKERLIERSRRDLAEAIRLLLDRPRLDAALEAATKRFQSSMDEADFNEQQRLRERKREFDQRLLQLAETGRG